MAVSKTAQHLCVTVFALLLSIFAETAVGAVPVHIVKADLRPAIRGAIDSPVQFAVPVPFQASISGAGSWSSANGRATWRYAVSIPTAVSLSFHAIQSFLPQSATLIVRGPRTSTSYRERDLHGGELWSRIHPGDALQFELTMAAADRDKVRLSIVSLQAGYRSLGPGVRDHPYYTLLKAQEAAVSGNAACVTNYECEITAGNTPPGSATVALVIGNEFQCSGSLINDVPGDNTPYLLTARHCETGTLGGGDPSAASAVTVYWDATTSCGAGLGSIYDPGIPIQTGAETILEQQDAWLIELNANPVVADAQFAGFDATGGAVQGGYTIHHAEGYDKQFTQWFGESIAIQQSGVLGTTYVSNFWETVNQLGNVGPGASGSGLFDQNNHLVGSLSLGRASSDPSGYGSCPVSNPPAPNGTNGVADFTSLAAVWNSTADTTTSTGSTTLKSVLDPGNTGTRVVASAPVVNIALTSSDSEPPAGQPLQLFWSTTPSATQCTASGGLSGDGWSGTLAPSGTHSVTETSAGSVTYGLSCTYAAGRVAKTSVSVVWTGPIPDLTLNVPQVVWTTQPATLSWTSNLTPCSISGGALALAGLAASGSTTTTQGTPGDVTYTLTCGPASDQGAISKTVSYVTPSLVLEETGSDRILGQPFTLSWQTAANECVPSGGAPDDGWANTAFFNTTNAPTSRFAPKVTTLGTYTYTLTCSSGSLSVQQSVTATFEQNAPYTTASLAPTKVTFSNSPSDYATLSWNSNASTCVINSGLSYSLADPLMIPYQAQGSAILAPDAPGSYTISVSCAEPGNNPTTVSSTPINLTVLPPPPPTETFSISPASVVQGQPFTVSWSSTNATYCEATGGVPGSGWATNGAFALPSTSQFIYTPGGPGQVGTFTFGITCESIAAGTVAPTSAQAMLTVQALSATLKSNITSLSVGSAFTLTWSSSGATDCTASGGGADGSPWSGTVATSGTLTQTATQSGTFTYTLACSANSFTATPQQVAINVAATSSSGGGGTGSTSTGGKGGGGALGMLDVAALGALLALQRAFRRPPRGRRIA
jgi:lysyl endopeptidase